MITVHRQIQRHQVVMQERVVEPTIATVQTTTTTVQTTTLTTTTTRTTTTTAEVKTTTDPAQVFVTVVEEQYQSYRAWNVTLKENIRDWCSTSFKVRESNKESTF